MVLKIFKNLNIITNQHCLNTLTMLLVKSVILQTTRSFLFPSRKQIFLNKIPCIHGGFCKYPYRCSFYYCHKRSKPGIICSTKVNLRAFSTIRSIRYVNGESIFTFCNTVRSSVLTAVFSIDNDRGASIVCMGYGFNS